MINISQDIYTYLASVTAVTDIASSRIWADRNTPPKTYRPDDGPAIAFAARGGLPAYDSRILRVSYKFKFYGATNSPTVSPQLSAVNLYRATYDALQDRAFASVRWGGCEVIAQQLEEFALNWPYTLAFFEFVPINSG